MPISFTNAEDPPLVETTDDASYLDSVHEDDASESGTEGSVSDYEGKLSEGPLRMLFGSKECRGIFEQASDQNEFVRVCGNKEGTCKRAGHAVLKKAREGFL
jgi:hypothetical protein